MSENIGIFTTSSDQWRLGISKNTRTTSDGSTRVPTFGGRSEHTRDYIVTNTVSDSDTTDIAPTVGPDCQDGDATPLCMNTSAGPGLPGEVSFAVVVINRVQLTITSAGFFANAATYLTLTFNGGQFSPLILLLLKHQSLLDTGVCGMGSLYLLLPTGYWLTGSRIVDFIICHSWHNQLIFWTTLVISVWNLVLIGVERYIMICKPFVYTSVTRKHFLYSFVFLYVGCIISTFPCCGRMNLVDGECSFTIDVDGFWLRFKYGYSFFVLFAFYLLPVVAFAFTYGYVSYAYT